MHFAREIDGFKLFSLTFVTTASFCVTLMTDQQKMLVTCHFILLQMVTGAS